MKAPISVLVPTRNEEANIGKCLQSLSWAAQVCIVDSHSSDRTAEIARAMGAQVAQFSWDGRGKRKYSWALENVPWEHEWLLIVDADEEVTPELREEIAAVVQSPTPHAGFVIRFHYYFLGRVLRHGDPLWKLILFRHRLARIEVRDVPEINSQMDVELHSYPILPGSLGRLRHPMIHRDLANLHHHFERHNMYSDGEALLRTRYRYRSRDAEVRPRLFGTPVERRRFLKKLFLSLPGKPWIYFLYSYVLRGGFLDGRAGFSYNVLKSFYWYQIGIKEYEIQLRDCPRRDSSERPAGLARERKTQIDFYRESVDPEEEITRPRCYPRPVQYLLNFKIRTAWEMLNGKAPTPRNAQEKTLVVCCGSGMEAEMAARAGQRIIALDLSFDAVLRARERARRYGLEFDLVVGDAENLPFASSTVDYIFVHDGLHHLPDAYRGVREMLRVARRAVLIAEPADAALTRLAVKLGISGKYEEAGNYVYRLLPKKLIQIFRECGIERWRFRRNLVYYQPWTLPIYGWFEKPPLFWVFRAGFFLTNLALGRWGNSLRVVAWKNPPTGAESP